MKTHSFLLAALAALLSIPLFAQQPDVSPSADADSNSNTSAKTTYAPSPGGFGDEASSRAWEMSPVTCELQGRLDSKTAKVGDLVVLKTTEKVQIADGRVIPRGSRLLGHVVQVQEFDAEHNTARIAVAFDRAEPKNAQSIAIHTLIRGVTLNGAEGSASQMSDEGMMGMPVPAGSLANGGRMGNGSYGSIAAANGAGLATGQVDRVADAAALESASVVTDSGLTTPPGGDLKTDAGAHGVAAARAIPHPTGIPGVMLAGSGLSSGVLSASKKNIQFESGTRIQLGVVADK